MGFGRERETRRRSRPGIEALEGRAVPATFRAVDVAQLQADLAAVSNTSGPNTIILTSRNYNLTGELQVQNAGNLTIVGNPSNRGATNIVAGFSSRALEIDGGTVTLSGLTISGGNGVAQGGGIFARDANLTVTRSAIAGNLAKQAGGGIYAQGGTLNVVNSAISNNSAEDQVACFGGGIAAVNATVNVSGSTIDNNTAFDSAAGTQEPASAVGGGIYTQGGTLTITSSGISANTSNSATSGTSASSTGGGLGTSNTVVSIARSTISNNTLSTIASQVAIAEGSALSNVGGSVTITNCLFSGNAPGGRNLLNHPGATVVLRRSTVDGQKFPGTYTLGNNGITPGR